MYLLDTSVWIKFLRNSNSKNQKLEKFVKEPLQTLSVATCGIVLYELLQGVKNNQHREDISLIQKASKLFKIEEEDYVKGGEIAQKLRIKNQFLPLSDIMIAVCALKNDALLISADKHFARIAKVEPTFKWQLF